MIVCVYMFERESNRLISIKIEVSPYSFGVGKCGCGGGGAVTLTYLYSYKKTKLVMMVFLPSCNIGHPIYIRWTGRKLRQFWKKIPTPLSAFSNKAFPRSSFSPTNLIVEQLRKEASGTNWPGGRYRRRQSPCLRSVRPPTNTTPNSSSPYLIFLEISLIFTHGITPARVNHNKCSVKKCILMFRAMHENLACNYITQITSRNWHFLTQPH